ncbi:MAG: YdcF family protein [Clostridia bacterium]|nr:YdcF family protein [Clostridiales bacterium]MBQ6715261.1 YdcF family protein [Clostridia bacterium]
MKKHFLGRAINLLFLLAALFCFLYYLLNGVLIRFGQSLLFLWPLMGLFFLARFIIFEVHYKTGKPLPFSKRFLTFFRIFAALCIAFFLSVEGMILKAALTQPPENLDYIIVLGAKVNGTQPSGALRNRIDVASEYLHENPETLVIASGGQGPDEGISEAECILRGLTQRGIDEDRVLMEDKSTSTLENLTYSLSLVEKEAPSIGLVTNNFHVYRSMKIAETFDGYEFHAVPVATSLISFPHYMLREFCATVVGFLTGSF